MKKMRAGALLMAALLSVCGSCSTPQTQYAAPSISPIDEKEAQIVSVTLYYYNTTGDRRTVHRSATLAAGESRAALVVESVLDKDWSDEMNQAPEDWAVAFDANDMGMELYSVEVSGNTANVDLHSMEGASIPQMDQRIKCRVSIANSLIETLGVSYVNVFFNGQPMDIDGRPLGAMAWYEGSPEEYYDEIIGYRERIAPYSIYATLYFPDATGNFLVMETQLLELNDLRGGEVVEALLQGPTTEGLVSIASRQLESYSNLVSIGSEGQEAIDEEQQEEVASPTNSPVFVTEGTDIVSQKSARRVEISLAQGENPLSGAAVVCSLMTLYSDISSVSVKFDDTQVAEEETLAQYQDKLGAFVAPYALTDGAEMLYRWRTIVPQSEADNPSTLLFAATEAQPDAGNLPILTEDKAAVQDVAVSGHTAIVKLEGTAVNETGQTLTEEWAELPTSTLRLKIYSIVNTLTQIQGVKQVQIQIDGWEGDSIGTISLRSPLLANTALCAD